MTPRQEHTHWTPQRWRAYWEVENPYRKYKLERDRSLAAELLQLQPGQEVLEVGCGYGRVSQALLRFDRVRLVTVDPAFPMLQDLKRHLRGDVVPCLAGAESLPFKDAVFDSVLCNGVLMHLKNPWAALQELCRVLKTGGRLVVSANNLLSFFSLPVMLWGKLATRVHQGFEPPWTYRRRLKRLGIHVGRVAGDTLLAVGTAIPGTRRPLLPTALLPALRALDRWVERPPGSYLAYEIWFSGIKEEGKNL